MTGFQPAYMISSPYSFSIQSKSSQQLPGSFAISMAISLFMRSDQAAPRLIAGRSPVAERAALYST